MTEASQTSECEQAARSAAASMSEEKQKAREARRQNSRGTA